MSGPIEAAVLVPVYRDVEDALRLILIVRAPGGPHGSQIAFPGGVREPGDASLLQTALREAHEEIGLPPDNVEVITPLDLIDTMSTGFTIAPYLAQITPPSRWTPQTSEVADVLDVCIDDLLAPGMHASRLAHFPLWPEPREISFYRLGPHELWGATYRIVHPLLPRLVEGEWRI